MWYAHYNPVIVPPPFYHYIGGGFPQLGFRANLGSGNNMAPVSNVQQVLEETNAVVSDVFGGMQLENSCKEEHDVEPDDRTLFLTFSKGHYIPEVEIREFFTRIFGNFIEGIYMQDASVNEQQLHARMVCRSSAIISSIAPPNRKTKYSINGKRFLASKYVKRSRG
ncbi:hypothetical protein POM88_020142 [Heracleum sosnowskyi]|uniref:Uncharacterized protein n=1 Tax=Heracleum sosnowskyi TaxID=360622 RepID=A0AAD8IDA9_9APIA|nr:hypothetical protein POM88_020142 [Heracleum sosnowskyi]